MKRERRSLTEAVVSWWAGLTGAGVAQTQAAGTDAMIEGMNGFSDMVRRVQDKIPHMRRGHLFEAIIAAKENASNASSGSPDRLGVTHLEGDNTAPADLVRRAEGQVIGQAQAKFSVQSPNKIAEMVADPKYHGMDRYVPSNKVEAVREALLKKAQAASDPSHAAEYLDAADRLKVHNTSTVEVWLADRSPELYRFTSEVTYVATEAGKAGAAGAAAAFIVGGAISGVRNWIAVARGEKNCDDAIRDTLRDAGKAGFRGGIVAAGGAVVRYGAARARVQVLTKANVATAVAAALIDAGTTVYGFAKGELSVEEAAERIGQTGAATVGGLYGGALGAAAFGSSLTLGAAVASMAGYMIASYVYQSSIAILRQARLAEAEATRVEALCEEAARGMRAQREAFERALSQQLVAYRQAFQSCFAAMDAGLQTRDYDQTTDALANIAGFLGRELDFKTFAEFDAFMTKGAEPLRI